MKGCKLSRESSGLVIWELSCPAETDRSHLFPHRETYESKIEKQISKYVLSELGVS